MTDKWREGRRGRIRTEVDVTVSMTRETIGLLLFLVLAIHFT
jgi:hypothetical protein